MTSAMQQHTRGPRADVGPPISLRCQHTTVHGVCYGVAYGDGLVVGYAVAYVVDYAVG